ncbi:hypothetical protein QQ020_00385 [Fulvivirgaceae bacterium BMA12]|uniref:Uncharacterized protein n=1 Tax=Agaribacillus aureus TaxID=3051825 RepID=A0ABT8KYE4_9BACT|nr:hypothetical protein [Fulvivirgaceae bacterium BMA12]
MNPLNHEDILQGDSFHIDVNSLALHIYSKEEYSQSNNLRRARIMHEYDHLVRLLGTSYGLVRHGFLTNYLEYFLKSLKIREGLPELVQDWNAVNRSAAKKPKMVSNEFEFYYFGDKSYSDVFKAQCLLESIRTLDGFNIPTMGIKSMSGWVQYFLELYGNTQTNPKEFHHYLSKLWGKKLDESKLIHLDGIPINIQDVLEYLGVVVELAYQSQDKQIVSEFPMDLPPKKYLQILNAIKEFLPNAFDLDTMNIGEEVESLLELALWIPLWPGMKASDLPEHAIHLIPSFRLGHILDACRELNLEFTFGVDKDVRQISPKAKEFQESICHHLGWESPTVIAKKWTIALEDISKHSDQWNRIFFHHPKSRRLEWSKKLISEFSQEPVSAPMLAGSRHYGKINFPSILYLGNKEKIYLPNRETDCPSEDRHFHNLDVLLFSASKNAVNQNDWYWLPPAIKQEAIETWNRLIAAEMF